MIPQNQQSVRRSLSARATACQAAIDILRGATSLKHIRPGERDILVESLRQTIELMTAMEPHKEALAELLKQAVLVEREKGKAHV